MEFVTAAREPAVIWAKSGQQSAKLFVAFVNKNYCGMVTLTTMPFA